MIMNEIDLLNELLPMTKGDQFKLAYITLMTMLSEDSGTVELPIGYLMQLMNKSERSVRKTLNELIEMGVLLTENGLYWFNLEAMTEEEPDEEKPKKVGFI